jgi:glycosyltransferase involved in cell wall biosynthesis
MNILQLITPARIGGAERSTASLCEHLQGAGHPVIVGCKSGSPLIEVMREAGLDARSLPISGKLNLRAPFQIAALARKCRVAVVHSHLSTAAWHGSLAARLARLPAIAHVRALNDPFWYRLADRVIAVSHAVKEHLVRRGMDASRIDVVYNGVDPRRYYLPCSREEARRRLGLPESGPLAGIVAHLSVKKGHHIFLEALARATARHPEARALFLGEGDQEQALKEQAKRLGLGDRVIFAGFQGDVLPYYAAMDVVVLPSIEGEGLPRALLEAGFLRRAAIGTRLSGTPEILREGESGFVVPTGDVETLAERLEVLFADASLRERMGEAGHAYVAATFTVQAMVAGTLAVYERAGVRL